MDETITAMGASEEAVPTSLHAREGERHSPRRRALFGGGPGGNEQLTTICSAILIVLLAVIGLTILRIGQLIWVHLFVGLVLVGPLVVKMASTGYRFARYYTRNPVYRKWGPPEPLMRAIAPAVVASTIVVFVSGLLLMIAGPGGRGQFLELHKVSFIVWLPFTALHVLGHLGALNRYFRIPSSSFGAAGSATDRVVTSSGRFGRETVLVGGLVAGLVLALALLPEYAPWTAHSALMHGH